jgi:hypothetical protein
MPVHKGILPGKERVEKVYMRARLLRSLLASLALNLVAWTLLPAAFRFDGEPQTRERPIVATSFVRLEHRSRISPTPQPKIAAATRLKLPQTPASVARPIARASPPKQEPESAMLGPPPPASLALPSGWSRQDLAFLGTTSTAEWLDWTHSKKTDKWVPRIFLWQMNAKPGYMRRPTLDDAVKQILDTLHDDARMQTSRAQLVCNGERRGWFFSYVKPEDDPPLHFEETVYMSGEKIYRAIYIRSVDQPEDPQTRAALNTLCWP